MLGLLGFPWNSHPWCYIMQPHQISGYLIGVLLTSVRSLKKQTSKTQTKCCLCITRKALKLLVLLLCKQFSLYFSLVMWAIEWVNIADSDLIFRGISFHYWWEAAKQDKISPVHLHLSTKLSQNCLKMMKIVFWKWFLVDLGHSMF